MQKKIPFAFPELQQADIELYKLNIFEFTERKIYTLHEKKTAENENEVELYKISEALNFVEAFLRVVGRSIIIQVKQ